MSKSHISEILIKLGVKEKHVVAAIERQKVTREPLTEVARDMGLVSGEKIAEAIAIDLGVNYFQPSQADQLDLVEMENLKHLVEEFDGFVPVGKSPHDGVTVAVSTPEMVNRARNVFTDHKPTICVASDQTIQRIYRHFFARTDEAFDNIVKSVAEMVGRNGEEKVDTGAGDSVQHMLCSLLRHACYIGASDIYLWQTARAGNIRLKVDGTGLIFRTLTLKVFERLINSLVSLSGVGDKINIEPQEARVEPPSPAMGVTYKDVFGRYVFRMELVKDPMTGYISAVIRVNDSQATEVDFFRLGFERNVEKMLTQWAESPTGLVLVTGPTGSGKTTTLYSMMREIDPINRAVFSIERPVEYRHGSWIQHELPKNTDEGAAARMMLKALLREAPDVILIGELRDDPELVKTALAAANTGHLVFATVHTNTAASAVMRLTEMGAQHEVLASVFTGVLAQRLLGTLCPDCKVPDERPETRAEMNQNHLDGVPITPFMEKGCEHCGYTGFRGRRMIYEIIDGAKIRRLIEQKAHVSELERTGIPKGESLWARGLKLVAAGVTSMDELRRRAKRDME